VATRRWIHHLWTASLLAAIASMLAGCGGSTANVQNPPPPPGNDEQVSFSPQPGGALTVGFSENLSANVTNDPNDAGVDWTLTCSIDPGNKNGLCGSLSTLYSNTDTNATTTYTAPVVINGTSMGVEIEALAADHNAANAVASITVSTFDSNLAAGNYVLQLQGVESGFPYQYAGVITVDGQGNIRNGEQAVNFDLPSGEVATLIDSNLSGTYFLGDDGRGTIEINTNDNNIGGNGYETFAFVLLSASQAAISQIDMTIGSVTANTTASATGTVNLQTSTAAPSGSYVFAVSGTAQNSSGAVPNVPIAIGGVIDFTSATAFSGVSDEIINSKMKVTDGSVTGTITAPDAFGGVTLTLTGLLDETHTKPISIQFNGYVIDANHIQLIETDTLAGSSVTAFATTGGVAVAQVANSYGTFSNSSFSGNYVLGTIGIDLSKANSSFTPSSWTAAALLTADGNGDLTSGYTDTFLEFNCEQVTCSKQSIPGAQISGSLTGSYTADASGNGRVVLSSFAYSPAPTPSYSPTYYFYLTGNNAATGTANAPAALAIAAGDQGAQPQLHYPSIGAGAAYAQSSSGAMLNGDYGFRFTQLSSSGEVDGTAQLNASQSGLSLSGIADSTDDADSTNLPDQAFTGTFSSPTASAPFSGVLVDANESAAFSLGTNTSQIAVDYYFIDQTDGFWIETDLLSPTPATGSGQVSLGQYYGRTPLCSGCP
jgi:hypothetical protein